MTVDDEIKYGKMQYNINREAAIISTLLSNDEYECLTGEEILPSDQSRTIEQASLHIPLSLKYLNIK